MTAATRPLARWQFLWPTLLVALCCAAALAGMARFARGQAQAVAEAQVREVLSGLRAQLDAVTEASFSASANLENLLRVQGELSETAFRLTVESMLAGQYQLRNVVAAPNDVIALVHPLEGNQRALGLDYRSVPAQWAQVERARQLRRPLIFAPVKLVQGGQGVIQRRPVYLRDKDGQPRYWGVISSVADLERFVVSAGLPAASIELALVEKLADGSKGQLIWGQAALVDAEVLQEELRLPGATWSLLGRPRGGWEQAWWQTPWLLGGMLTSLVLVALSALLGLRRSQLLQRQAALEEEVQARMASQAEAEQARARLQTLLATASDWFWEQDEELRLSYYSGSDQDGLGPGPSASLGQRRWEMPTLVPGQPDDASWALHRQQLAERRPFRDFRYAFRRADGAIRWVSVSGDPIFDSTGRFRGYRGTGRDISAMRELDAALVGTRERLQAVFAAATQVAIIATDLHDRITDFNAGAERLLGYPAAVVMGSSPHRFHDPAEIALRAAEIGMRLGRVVSPSEVFRLNPGEPQIWTMLRRDGSRVTVSLVINELRDAQGQLLGHLGLALDLSTELAAQSALRNTAQRLQAVLDSAEEVSIVTCDLQGRIEIFSRGAERLLGCKAADAIGTLAVRFHLREEVEAKAAELSAELGRPGHWSDVFLHQAEGKEGSHTRLWTYVRADNGQPFLVSHTFTALRGPDGAVSGYLAIARDVSQQVAAEQAQRELRDRLQAVLDAALDVGILAIDLQGRVQLFNKGAERLFGYASEEILGQSTLRLHDPEELTLRAQAMSAELGRTVHRYEVFMLPLAQSSDGTSFSRWTYVRKDGVRVPGALRLSRMLDREGRVSGFLAIAIDIGAEVRAQAALEALNRELEQRVLARTQELALAQDELLRTERLAALGSLVAGVAHELNTPLGTAMTAASTLKDRTRELQRDLQANQLKRSTLDAYAQDGYAMAELLMRSLSNATELVAHFKQLSVDQTSDNRRRFELEAVVADVLTVLRPQLKGSRLHIDTEVALEQPIDAYPGELGRLLTNLILNAQLHAFAPGEEGELRISARPLPGERYELVVADNGRGMPEEVRRRAFDPFFTTKLGQGGSGLGLNIVWNIATGVLGGTVRLESAPGRGTRFVFELPMVAPQRSAEGSDLRPTAR